MKKNKGFSLVELIIVIAIMAILAAAIAPALIRYIDKSRKADDVTAAGTIATAANAALANEAAYESIDRSMNGTTLIATGVPGAGFQKASGVTGSKNDGGQKFVDELNANLTGNVAPKLKYKKTLSSPAIQPTNWYLYISTDVPMVYVGNGNSQTSDQVQLAPSIHEEYQ